MRSGPRAGKCLVTVNVNGILKVNAFPDIHQDPGTSKQSKVCRLE